MENMENMELNLNEMEEAVGGAGGYDKKPAAKKGCIIYQIKTGETLGRIARKFGTTVNAIVNVNKAVIPNPNFIRAGFYIYIPQ